MSILKIENLSFSYGASGKKIFKDFNQEFEEGKIYAIIGRSGAGKTTLLSLLAGLAYPTDGVITVEDKDISKLDAYHYRSHDVGIVFQSFNLLPKLTATENVVLSMDISEQDFPDKQKYAEELLCNMGLSGEECQRPILHLSGGQQQRVALARAISYNPKTVLADEPTGNLDGETQKEILEIFKEMAHKENRCVIIVTHSPVVAEAADCVVKIS